MRPPFDHPDDEPNRSELAAAYRRRKELKSKKWLYLLVAVLIGFGVVSYVGVNVALRLNSNPPISRIKVGDTVTVEGKAIESFGLYVIESPTVGGYTTYATFRNGASKPDFGRGVFRPLRIRGTVVTVSTNAIELDECEESFGF